MLNRSTRYLLAALEAIIGWEWLMSGGNKLLASTFPQGLADALNRGIKDNPNSWYVSILQTFVLPHSILYGYLIEWSEIVIGLVLLGGALLLLGEPRGQDEAQHRQFVGYSLAVIFVAALAAFENINFHFWMGGWVIPTFTPATPYNEGIDLDGLLPLLCLVIIVANIALIKALRGGTLTVPFFGRFNKGTPGSEPEEQAEAVP
jgi:thiosulfate dehydrogenase [quinone] large subunit